MWVPKSINNEHYYGNMIKVYISDNYKDKDKDKYTDEYEEGIFENLGVSKCRNNPLYSVTIRKGHYKQTLTSNFIEKVEVEAKLDISSETNTICVKNANSDISLIVLEFSDGYIEL